jgi:hypothetical protein
MIIIGRVAQMDNRTIKLIFGSVCFLFNLAVLVSGIYLIIVCFPGLGEGEARVTVKDLGEVSGVNGHAVGLFIGAAMVLCSLMYTHKAYRETLGYERLNFQDIVRHHSPQLGTPKKTI